MKVKKFLSTLLVMAMVVSLLPGIAPQAEATKETGYTITNDASGGFAVSGKGDGYKTLAEALAECVPPGGEGVPSIQFGDDADHPLLVTESFESKMTDNGLKTAIYGGWIHIQDNAAVTNGFGVSVNEDADVTFKGLILQRMNPHQAL